MSVFSMAVRSALRGAQDNGAAENAVVVSGLQPNVAGATVEAAPEPPASNPVAELLERLAAWIPTESIGTFIAFGGMFSIYDKESEELGLVGAVVALTIGYAYTAAMAARARRGLPASKSAAVKTAAVAVVSFLVWWIATPGTWLTADKNVGELWVAIGLLVFAAALPTIARWLGVEPLKS